MRKIQCCQRRYNTRKNARVNELIAKKNFTNLWIATLNSMLNVFFSSKRLIV